MRRSRSHEIATPRSVMVSAALLQNRIVFLAVRTGRFRVSHSMQSAGWTAVHNERVSLERPAKVLQVRSNTLNRIAGV